MHGARCKVQGAPALSMLAGLGRARQMQGARCKVPSLSGLDWIRLDFNYIRFRMDLDLNRFMQSARCPATLD